MEHGPQEKRQNLAKINFTTETMLSCLKFQKQEADAYLHRYSKGRKIVKWTVFPKIQKKYPINNCPLFPSQKIIATVNGVFDCCHYFEHPSATQSVLTVNYSVAANRLSALFAHLIYYLKKAIVNSHPNVCRALIQSLCKHTVRAVLATSFQPFLTRYFLQAPSLNTNSQFQTRQARV